MELAIAEYFNIRQNLIVPNVSWGFGIHECDLFVLTKTGYCYEVEIKISLSDLKADLKKRHHHLSPKICKLYFAIPDKLLEAVSLIPKEAGILLIHESDRDQSHYSYPILPFSCGCVREARIYPSERLDIEQKFQIARLGTLRIWSLKKKIKKLEEKL
jgi:hypothetical protein